MEENQLNSGRRMFQFNVWIVEKYVNIIDFIVLGQGYEVEELALVERFGVIMLYTLFIWLY